MQIVWRQDILPIWRGDKPGERGGGVKPLELWVYFRDHTGSLDNSNIDT
jgi:hypothetical protein